MRSLGAVDAFLFAAFFASNLSYAIEPRIHTVIKRGTLFRHFEIELSASNTLLPKDIKNREPLDESSGNFIYGQFEVFVPSKHLKLPFQCKSNYIVRMAQTLDQEPQEVKRKQALYYAIKAAQQGRAKGVRVVLEIVDDSNYACNLFFRSDRDGRYIDYVGKIKPKTLPSRQFAAGS